MNYYRRYVGDYLRDTARLSMLEHGAYTLLLDYCYADEQPLPLDRDELYLMVRAMTSADRKAVDKILAKYFTEEPDGYHQKRVDHEIAVSKKARDNGGKGGRPVTGKVTGSVTGDITGTVTGEGGGSVHPPTTNHQPPATSLQPPPKDAPSADADPWKVGKEFLIARGVKPSQAGAIIGKWAKDHGHPATIAALQAAIDGQVVEPVPYIVAALQNRPGKKFDPVAYNARTA